MTTPPPFGTTSVFTSLGRARRAGLEVTAATTEGLGFGALWLADVRGDLTFLPTCLAETSTLAVGSAVLSIWDLDPHDAASAWAAAESASPGRAVLGIGVSHPALAARAGRTYERPMAHLRAYLDAVEEAGVPAGQLLLGANGPGMLALAGARSAGAITQMVTSARTAEQRTHLGPDAVLATEVKVVTSGGRDDVRRLGRANLAHYLGMPSYAKNLAAMGFADDDLADGGSDRLVDALVAGPDDVAGRVAEQRDAGADHVCLHVLADDPAAPLEGWRALADLVDLVPTGAS